MKKRIITICAILTMVCAVMVPIYADVNVSFPDGSNKSNNQLNQTLGRTWATVSVVVQILSIGLVVFAGLRYMFASADKKADIKRRINLFGYRCCNSIYCIYNNKFCCKCGE